MEEENSYEIRPFSLLDKNEVIELCKECFPVEYSSESFDKMINDPDVYQQGVFCNKKLVALIFCKLNFFLKLPFQDKQGQNDFCKLNDFDRVAYVMLIGVTSSYRKQNIASRLLREFIDHAIENKSCAVYLHMHHQNETAKRFYEKHSFKFSHDIPGYYFISLQEVTASLYYLMLPKPQFTYSQEIC